MTCPGTLRVNAPPPSPPRSAAPATTPSARACRLPPQSPSTPSTFTLNHSPRTSPSTPAADPPTPRRQPPVSKNLRWTAVTLVSKLSKERERPSAAIADEVALAASHDMLRRFPKRDVAPIERNTRRRVYDALKVMVAVGCLQRHGKDLRWIGVDHLRHPAAGSSPSLRVSLCEARRRVGRKKARLVDMQQTIRAFDKLYSRHRREHEWQSKACRRLCTSARIHFPLAVVKARHPDVVYSGDRKRVRIATEASFRLYSETDIVYTLAEQPAFKKPRLTRKTRQVTEKPASEVVAGQSEVGDPTTTASDKSPVTARSNFQCNPRLHIPQKTRLPRQTVQQRRSRDLPEESSTAQGTHATRANDSRGLSDMVRRQDTGKSKGPENSGDHVKEEVIHDCSSSESELRTDALPSQVIAVNIRPSPVNPGHPDANASTQLLEAANGKPTKQVDDEGAPLVCNEELGIPPLADDESFESDDGRMGGWKVGDGGEMPVERVFRAPQER